MRIDSKNTNSLINHIKNCDFSGDYNDFRNKLNAYMEAKELDEAEQMAVNTFLTASIVVANARESQSATFNFSQKINDFNLATKEQHKDILAEQINIIKNPFAIQKGSYLGNIENTTHFIKRRQIAIDVLSEILQEFSKN